MYGEPVVRSHALSKVRLSLIPTLIYIHFLLFFCFRLSFIARCCTKSIQNVTVIIPSLLRLTLLCVGASVLSRVCVSRREREEWARRDQAQSVQDVAGPRVLVKPSSPPSQTTLTASIKTRLWIHSAVSMSSQKPAGTQAKGQATLLGFFKKVDQAKSKSNTGNGTASREAVPGPSQPSFTASRTVTAAKTAVYAKNGPIPSPPSSVSGGSVSPVASSSKPSSVSKRPSIGGPRDGVFVPSAGSSKISSKPATISPAADEQPPTPPPSSPPPVRSHDKVHTAVDDDDDEEMPSVTRRRSAAKKRKSYFESGSEGEGDDGSDYEQDVKRSSKTIPHDEDDDDDDDDDDMEALSDASSSPVPSSTNRKKGSCATKRPNKTAGASQAKRPRSSLSAFGANSSRPAPPAPRPALPHASSSATSSSSMDSSAKAATGFAFLNDRRDMDGNRPGDADFDPRTLLIPARAWGDMTNFEKQYFEIKQYNMDTILMFQKGKFYEMFLEDARIAHQKLDLKLTDRGRMPMVGVPESSFDLFATKLLALGFKVGRVDQMETAVAMGMRQKASSGEIVRRELRHVMTSGTMIDGLEDDQANYCIALVEEIHQVEGQDDVISFGVCALDAATSDFNLSHWRDDLQRSQLETLLTSLRVKEVIHKKGQLSRETSRLIRNCVAADCRITMLREGKEWFSPEATRSEILELFGDEEGAVPEAILAVQDNEVAMSSLAGMFAYLAQLSLLKDLTSSKNFSLLEHRKTAGGQPMHMDANTLSHLCVLANEDGSDAGTLHRLLNRCFTPAGKRLFKLWLTHPMSDMTAINARQEAVEDMLGNMDFEECLARLKKLPDFERLIPKVASGKIKPGEFTRLLSSFKKMTPIVDDLVSHAASFTSELVKKLLYTIPNVASLAAHLDAMFVAEEDGSFQPRDGVDEDYDQAQAAVDAVEEELESELKKYRKQLGLGAQKSGGCNWKHRGTNEIYQVEVPKKTRVPNDWAIVSQTNASVGYYSPSLRALVQSLKEARETRVAALKAFHAQLFIKFNEKAPSYLMAVRALAELDCLHSLALASYALGEPTCRPTLIDCDTALVDFEELRHPCIASATDFIANDIQMGGDAAEVIVLTGGNMAGKSTTARTTATGVILAQLGCRVPAKSATLSPADRICSRMGANDQIFKNSSTFMVEMLEASRIVKDCTPRSLVIMDELGRGTSTFDGHAIAHAVLHHLIARTRCLCFFLTHYLQLAYDFQGYPRCANKHMAVVVDDEKREVVFTYKLVEGVAESSYGTQVAHLAGVPAKICDRANDISLEFAAATKEQQAQRTTSALPMATLSDFAYLFKLGSGPAEPQVNTQQIVSQLNVIRSQITRVVSADAVMAEGDAHLCA